MKIIKALLIFGLLNVITVFAAPANLLDEIDLRLQRQEITYDEAVLNKVYAVLSPEKIDAEIKKSATQLIKCGTPVFVEYELNKHRLSSKTVSEIEDMIAVSESESYDGAYVSPGGKFNIHYNTSGTDAVPSIDANSNGIPDYVESFGEIFDHVWQVEIVDLGYVVPELGSNNMQEVYIENLEGAYGWVQGGDNLHVDNDYVGFPNTQLGNMQVTAAHEFHHEIQYQYNLWMYETWYMETTSTYMEDYLYDDVNDYINYLSGWFSSPWTSLGEFDGLHEYSSCILNHYLAEKFEVDIIRKIWEDAHADFFGSANAVLSEYDASADMEYKEFLIWNYFTGSRSGFGHATYSEAEYWREMSLQADVDFSEEFRGIRGQAPLEYKYPQNRAANYLRFNNEGSGGSLFLQFFSNADVDWQGIVLTDSGSSHEIDTADFVFDENTGRGVCVVDNWNELNNVVFIPQNANNFYGNGAAYSYSAEVIESQLYLDDVDFYETSGKINEQFESSETGALTIKLENLGDDLENVSIVLASLDHDVTINNMNYTLTTFSAGDIFDNSGQPFTFAIGDDVSPRGVELLLVVTSANDTLVKKILPLYIGHAPVLLVDDAGGEEESLIIESVLEEQGVYYIKHDMESQGLSSLDLSGREYVFWSVGQNTASLSGPKMDSLESAFFNKSHVAIIGSAIGTPLSATNWCPVDVLGTTNIKLLTGEPDDLFKIKENEYILLLSDNNELLGGNGPIVRLPVSYINVGGSGIARMTVNGYRKIIIDFALESVQYNFENNVGPDTLVVRILNYFDSEHQPVDNFGPIEPDRCELVFNNVDSGMTFSWALPVTNPLCDYSLIVTPSNRYDKNVVNVGRTTKESGLKLKYAHFYDVFQSYGDSVGLYWGIVADDGVEPVCSDALLPLTLVNKLTDFPIKPFELIEPGDNDTLGLSLYVDNIINFSWEQAGPEASYTLYIYTGLIADSIIVFHNKGFDTVMYFNNDELISLMGGADELWVNWYVVAESDGEHLECTDHNRILLKNIDNDIAGSSRLIPEDLKLHSNYPNPFNPITTIEFEIAQREAISLLIYNVIGQKVRTLAKNEYSMGFYQMEWNGKNDAGNLVPSGIYYCVLQTKQQSVHIKMLLLK